MRNMEYSGVLYYSIRHRIRARRVCCVYVALTRSVAKQVIIVIAAGRREQCAILFSGVVFAVGPIAACVRCARARVNKIFQYYYVITLFNIQLE